MLSIAKRRWHECVAVKLTGLARRQDTRRKVLAGAFLLELMAKDAELQKQMMGKLSTFLVRPDDRVLFGLRSVGE